MRVASLDRSLYPHHQDWVALLHLDMWHDPLVGVGTHSSKQRLGPGFKENRFMPWSPPEQSFATPWLLQVWLKTYTSHRDHLPFFGYPFWAIPFLRSKYPLNFTEHSFFHIFSNSRDASFVRRLEKRGERIKNQQTSFKKGWTAGPYGWGSPLVLFLRSFRSWRLCKESMGRLGRKDTSKEITEHRRPEGGLSNLCSGLLLSRLFFGPTWATRYARWWFVGVNH